MKRLLAGCLLTATMLAAPLSRASFHTFAIDQVYSNADASVQFIVLHEVAGLPGQEFLAGHALTSNGPGGSKAFLFPGNLPSSNTGGRRVLIATTGFAALGIVTPDYVIPNGFVPLMNGTLDYASVDLVTYASLPTDGTHSLYRNGSGAPNLATNFAGQSASVQAPPPTTTPDINQHGLTGSWYEPATSGQGVEVEVFANPSSGTGSTFVSWFTYDTVIGGAERQRWYTAQGPVATGQPIAALTVYQNTGGNFDAPPVTNAQAVGTAALSFDTCASGQLTYTFSDGSGRTGTIPLTRLTQNVTCSTTTPHPTNADFALSGNWFGPATSGQGLTVEINPISGAFLAWYTYIPNGSAAGVAGQRWYTAQGTFAPGMRSIPLTIYQTSGGIFDTPPPSGQNTVAVGTGTMAFQSCTAAKFSYNFTGGTGSGLTGTIDLSRVGPVPPGCVF